jgi:uncharacterized protein HemX
MDSFQGEKAMNTETNHEPSVEPEVRESQPESPAQQDAVIGDQEPAYFGQVSEGDHFEIGNANLKLIVIGLAILVAAVLGLSMIFASVDKSANDRADGVKSVMAEQQQLMREAMDMAREAQTMNRQRMAEMRRAMEEAEGYGDYAEFRDYAGAGDGYDYDD